MYSDLSSLDKLNEEYLASNANSLHHVHEYIKLKSTLFEEKDISKLEKAALKAL